MGLHKINVEVSLTEINCGCCGGTYAINERYRKQKYEEGGGWNCPYCRANWGFFSDNENKRLRKKLEQEEKRRKWAEENAQRARESADESERRRVAQKAATTRLRNRAKAGLCPCCNRHFKQLAAHMKNKHPEFAAEVGEDS